MAAEVPKADFNLPTFVTATAVAELLEWAPSLQRQFRQRAKSHHIPGWSPPDGDLYLGIVELLRLPNGLTQFSTLVSAFDSKRRDLLRAVSGAAWHDIPVRGMDRPRSPNAVLSSLITQRSWDLAAWFSWCHLEVRSAESEAEGKDRFVELIGSSHEITLRLGDYWTKQGWLRGSKCDTGSSRIASSEAPPQEGDDEGDIAIVELRWHEQVDALVHRLSGASISDDLEDEIGEAGQRLGALSRRWAELTVLPSSARLDAALADLSDVLQRADPALSIAGQSTAAFIDSLRRDLESEETDRVGKLERAAQDLRKLVEDAANATRVEELAKHGWERDDSDAAFGVFAEARNHRRTLSLALQAFADKTLADLLEQPESPGDIGAPHSGGANDSEIAIVAFDVDVGEPAEQASATYGAGEQGTAEADRLQVFGPIDDDVKPDGLLAVAAMEANEVLSDAEPGERTLASQSHPLAEGAVAIAEPQAKGAQRSPGEAQNTVMEMAIGEALIAKRYGLAFHLAAAAEAHGLVLEVAPPAVLEALAVGAAAGGARLLPAVSRYKALQEAVLLAMEGSSTPWTRLLVFAGALRPALFAPDTSGVEILGRANLREYGKGLHELCQFVTSEIRGRGLNLTPADFEPATADEDRRAAEEGSRRSLLDFAATAPSRKLKFHRAIVIWTDVFRQGPVADAVAAIQKRAPNAPALAQTAEEWIYNDTAEHRVDLLDVDHRSKKDRPLEAGVRLRLADWLRQTAQHLRVWAEANEACERTQGEHVLKKLRDLRRHLNAARADLESVASGQQHLRAPVTAVLDVVIDLFARSDTVTESPLTLEMALNDDLLLFEPPIFRRGPGGWSTEEAETIVRHGPAISAAPADFKTLFHDLVRAGRFGAARHVLERLVLTGADAAPLKLSFKNSVDTWLAETITRAEKMRGKIDDLLGADQHALIDVGLSTRLDGLLTMLRAEASADETQLDFAELDEQLKAIEADARSGFEILLIPLRESIGELKTRGRDTAELEEMAEHHDLATLAEHIDAALSDVDWTAKRPGALLELFAGHCLNEEYERIAPQDRNISDLIRAAQTRRRTVAADFSVLDEGEANRAHELLTAWRELRNQQGRREPAIAKLMLALGFGSAEATDNGALGKAQGAPRRMTLRTDKIADRDLCRVPAFGSEANGSYEVILAESSAVKTGEELTGWLDQVPAATTTPTFIVIAGHLPLKSRNLFMTAVRRRGGSASCGLIDEAMVIFLAAQPDRRRRHLFDLALPMGLVQPYADTAARTSQEMFYGRKRELDDLWDRDGSCLVYGGRQLGKTALLKQIQLRHNAPPSQLVIYGDLQAELPSADGRNIWAWLGRKLKSEPGFARLEMKNQREVEAAIRGWLDSDKRRRLLVLVDEADEFLRQELVDQYSSLAKIRDLMQATERYCKFVFAGLHDVQRLARTPNSPLLHFGAPVRVGPLMGSDLPEARAMAEGPMAAAGFVFKSPSLTGRMLSQVGYYPSLLQALAKGLIERMNKSIGRRQGSPGSSLVPLMVAERDLEETFADSAFRKNIQLKFENTLNLDERYRLITFVMLVDSLARRDQGALPIGLRDVEVQRLALDWWPQGFSEDQSLDAFQGLLQEMIGLGVLIEQADGRFVIRSARIADMLGGREQIEQKLLELSSKEAPARLDTGALRRLCGQAPSPLTARQETMLLSETKRGNAVHLLASSLALGVDQVEISLSDIADEAGVKIDQRSYQNLRQLEQGIEAVAASLDQRQRGLLVLSGPWLGSEMMTLAARNPRVRQAQKDGRYGIRVLLVPYGVDWREMDATFDGEDIISLSPLGETSLSQYVKRHWSDSLHETQVKEIRRLTGGFPRFLHKPDGRNAADMVESLRQRAEKLYQSADLFGLLGLDDDALVVALSICELGYAGEDSYELMRDEGIEHPLAALRQLERLGIVERYASQQSYEADRRLNPMVEAALARRRS